VPFVGLLFGAGPTLHCSGKDISNVLRFAWNVFAFDHRIAARLDGVHQKEPVPQTIRYVVGDNRIDMTLDDGATSALWWATKNEWLRLLDVTDLQLEALYGGLAGEPFADDSREYVFVVRP